VEIFNNWRSLMVCYLIITGVWGVLVKLASARLNPFTLAVVAGTTAWVTVIVFSIGKLSWQSGAGIWIAAVSGIVGGISVIIFYTVLKAAAANVVIPLSTLYVFVTVVLSYFFLGETMTLKHLLGIILGFISVFLLTS
jgi:uncharacterized membrane protein